MDTVKIDSIDTYNRIVGLPTMHPLAAVVDLKDATNPIPAVHYDYELYALFLKKGTQCSLRYGRQKYDFQIGSVVTFSPGQGISPVSEEPDVRPDVIGLLFHPDLVYGTPLASKLHEYSFFGYADNEAVHLSDDEHDIFLDCIDRIRRELEHPIDRHSSRLLCAGIDLLLEYMNRFYDRQFITRSKVNSEIAIRFENDLKNYYAMGEAEETPSVAFFANRYHLSPGYFGDLIKKNLGVTAQDMISRSIVDAGKELLATSAGDINGIAYQLGFQYPQHFTRMFKKHTGHTPREYRLKIN